MKKYFVFVFLCFCVFVLLSACSVLPQTKTATIHGHEYKVELAQTDAEKVQGLSGRKSLAENAGMLFVYDDYQQRFFWMKDMNFPLDIIWIKDGLVVACAESVPVLTNGQITRLSSPEPVNYVLEVNAGVCEQDGIGAGARVDIN